MLGVRNFNRRASHAKGASDLASDHNHLARGDPQPVIRHATGESESRFHHVEPIHFGRIRLRVVRLSFRLAAGKKLAHRPLEIDPSKITVQGEDAIRFCKIDYQLHSIAKDRLRGIPGERFILVEFRTAKFRCEFLDQSSASRAVIGTEEEANFRRFILGQSCDHRLEICSRGAFARLQNLPRAGRRIKIQDRSGSKGIRSIDIRMQMIRGKLGRASFVGGHHQWRRPTGTRHGGGVKSRFPRDDPLGSLGVGDNVGFRAAASGHPEPSERAGCSHQFQERAARSLVHFRVRELGSTLRKLPVHPLPKFGGVFELTRTAPSDGSFAGGNFGMMPDALTHF